MVLALVLCVLSGLLLCVTHGFWPWVGYIATVPLWIGFARLGDDAKFTRTDRFRGALYGGLLCGCTEALILWGMVHAGWAVWGGLCLWYGLVRALYAVVLMAIAAPGPGRYAWIWVGPALWAVFEWVHAKIPYILPNLLGDTQHEGMLLPLAAVGGTYVISFVLVASGAGTAGVLLWLLARAGSPSCKTGGKIGTGPFCLHKMDLSLFYLLFYPVALIGGIVWLCLGISDADQIIPIGEKVRVAAVQGGVSAERYGNVDEISPLTAFQWDTYTNLSTVAPPADLTIWPETSVGQIWFGGAFGFPSKKLSDRSSVEISSPSSLSQSTDSRSAATTSMPVMRGSSMLPFAQDIAEMTQRRGPLLMGALRRDESGAVFNSALLFQVGKSDPVVVDKQRLALRVESYATPGTALPLLPAFRGGGPLGVIFCLESVVPEHACDLVRAGATWLVVLADGSRFGTSAVGRMHAQRSIVRAVEVGRDVVHVGQSGETMLIRRDGSHTHPVPAYQASVLVGDVQQYRGNTMFVQWGGRMMLMPWLVVLGAALLSGARAIGRWRTGMHKP